MNKLQTPGSAAYFRHVAENVTTHSVGGKMLDTLSLKNFKSFSNLEGLKIKPITVICGANSCGKSSILQSILLLKQTFDSKTVSNTVLMNGKYVRLGNLENVIHGKDLGKEVSFELKFSLRPSEISRFRPDRRVPLGFMIREFLAGGLQSGDRKIAHYIVNLKIVLAAARRRKRTLITRPTTVKEYVISFSAIDSQGECIEGASIRFEHLEKEEYRLSWNNTPVMKRRSGSEVEDGVADLQVRFVNLLPQVIGFDRGSAEVTLPPIVRVGQIVQTLLASYSYLGPLREEPARRYIYEDEVMETGTKGESAAYLYLDQKDNKLADHYHYDGVSRQYVLQKEGTIEQHLCGWLSSMGINGFDVESVRDIIHVMVDSGYKDTPVSIADVGFGVSQIFPILFEGLRVPRGFTMLLEQPEIHLHPKLQMQLADYFISLALSRKNIIVETHSDHIVNRLVRRIVEDDGHELKDLISIYFVKPGEDGAEIEAVEIDPLRGIVNWPEDFFDQTASEQEAIMRSGIAKRRAMRGN